MSLCLCLSVSLSQVGVLSKRLNESGWFLAWELPSTYPTFYCKEIQVSSKIRVLPTGTFAPNSGIRKVRHRISIVEACYQLTSRKVDAQSVINWAVVGQLRRSTARVYHMQSSSSVYCTIQWRGQWRSQECELGGLPSLALSFSSLSARPYPPPFNGGPGV